ncbi:MAG: class II fructose-bisphosphate aldolase [Solirubrobacteraceae bacterium]|jgi:hypothetical protein
MPLATRDQYAMMLAAAADGGYALAAINVTSSETLNAAVRGFELAEADGIVQVTVGGAEFLSGAEVADGLLGSSSRSSAEWRAERRTAYRGVLKVDGGVGDKHSFDPRAWGGWPRPGWLRVFARRAPYWDRPAGACRARGQRTSYPQNDLAWRRVAGRRRA